MLARMWRKGNTFKLLVGMWIGTTTVENNTAVSQKTKNRTTIWHSNSIPGYISKNQNTNSKCTQMFIAALFTIAQIWDEPKCPSIDEWIKKMWYIHIHEKKKMEVLVTQSCPAHCDPMDYSLPGSSVHGILQARILEWVAILFSRGSS